MRITVDRDACIGSGSCVRAAPEVFDQDDEDGLVVLLTAEPPPEADRAVRFAVQGCPGRALAADGD